MSAAPEAIGLPCYRVVAKAVRDTPPRADIVSFGASHESPSAMDMEARRLAVLTLLGYFSETPHRQASHTGDWRTPPPRPAPSQTSTAPTHRPATCPQPPAATGSCLSAAASTNRRATSSYAGSRAMRTVVRSASQVPWVPPSPSASSRGGRKGHAREEPRPRPLELPTSAARNVLSGGSRTQDEEAPRRHAKPSSFRSRKREVAERKARAQGEVARLPPDRPTLSSSLKRSPSACTPVQ